MLQTMTAFDELSLQTTQLLLCDLQIGIVDGSKTTKPDELGASSRILFELARLFELPVTLSVVPANDNAPKLITELADAQRVSAWQPRTTVSPMADLGTATHLNDCGRRSLIIAGVLTEAVVLHAALDARRLGYDVFVPVDACGGMSGRTEDAAFRQIDAAGGVTTSITAIATKLAPDLTTATGRSMFGLVQQLHLI